jgi:L(+)-tartrate dehydratase beta subunit
MAHYDFATPISEKQARQLRVNDTVTLNGTLFGIRDATQIHMFDRGRKTRFDMAGHAVIHTAPNVRKPKPAMHPCAAAPPPATGWHGSRGPWCSSTASGW